MRFENYINEDVIKDTIGNINKMTFDKAKNFLKSEFNKFVKMVIDNDKEREVLSIINKSFKTKYKTLNDINKQKIQENINEGATSWWDIVKSEAFPTLAFYPALTVWLEIDKLFNGNEMDTRKTIVYSLFWLLLVTGKYVSGMKKWQKQKGDE